MKVQIFKPDPKREDGGNFVKIIQEKRVTFIPMKEVEVFDENSDYERNIIKRKRD